MYKEVSRTRKHLSRSAYYIRRKADNKPIAKNLLFAYAILNQNTTSNMASVSIGLNRNVHRLSTYIFRQMQSIFSSSECSLIPHHRSITSSATGMQNVQYIH